MSNIVELGITHINVITVAKVASSAFLKMFTGILPVFHRHSLQYLKDVLQKNNQLIITGVRNIHDRNISYFFQTYYYNKMNDVKIKANKYIGENCYLFPKEEIYTKTDDDIIDLINNSPFNKTYYEWFEEFFELTEIQNEPFNKDKGFTIYKLKNNNYLLLYTFEKLQHNEVEICNFLNSKSLPHTNNKEDDEELNKLYKRIKSKMEHQREINNDSISNYFY